MQEGTMTKKYFSVTEKQAAWLKIATSITENPPRSNMNLGVTICPECESQKLHFSFSIIDKEKDWYGLFLVCDNHPRNYIHYSLRGKPQGYDENLINEKYQQIEHEATKQSQPYYDKIQKKE